MKRIKYFAILVIDAIFVSDFISGFSIAPSINIPDSVSSSSTASIEPKTISKIASTKQIPVFVENIESKFRNDAPNKLEKNISSDSSDIKPAKHKKDQKLMKVAIKFNGKVSKKPRGGIEIAPVTEENKNASRRANDDVITNVRHNISMTSQTTIEPSKNEDKEPVTSSSVKRDLKDEGPSMVENNKEYISKSREELLTTISKLEFLFDKVNNQQNNTDTASHIIKNEEKSESDILMLTAHNLLKTIKKSLETQKDLKKTLETFKNVEKKEVHMPIDEDNLNRRGLPQEKSYNILRDGLDLLDMGI